MRAIPLPLRGPRRSSDAQGSLSERLWRRMVKSHTLEITGMTCHACARHVEQALLSVPGVHTADVSYPQGTARVTSNAMNTAVLASAVTSAGYGATSRDDAAVSIRKAGSSVAPERRGTPPPARGRHTPLRIAPIRTRGRAVAAGRQAGAGRPRR